MSAWYLEPRGAISSYVVGESDEYAQVHDLTRHIQVCQALEHRPRLRFLPVVWHVVVMSSLGMMRSLRKLLQVKAIRARFSSLSVKREKDGKEDGESLLLGFLDASWDMWFQEIQNYWRLSKPIFSYICKDKTAVH